MLIFDTSSLIHAWDEYPIEKFPKLWEWIGGEIRPGNWVIPEVVSAEVAEFPECYEFIRKNNIRIIIKNDDMLRRAEDIKKMLEITPGRGYSKDGVGENDITIIATAWSRQAILITNEKEQENLPTAKRNYKIPAVCRLPQINIPVKNFLTLIKESDKIF